ncbi:MOSC domain-containing protein [Massilia niabensis]|uniref:MOSC domain-containing protein n=1 Tax=Massilia niabensis TaxID=544910 RepID=A0ABW0L8N9_9BURK
MSILGSVQALAVRPLGTSAPIPVEQVQALAGTGLQGDMHAHALSPRQLLFASSHVYASLALPPHALRENLLVDIDTSRLASGTVLQVGSKATIRLMFQCEACGGLDTQRPGLSRAIGASRGMLARVLCGGRIGRGDTIRALDSGMPPWPEDWRARVALVLDAVPPGSAIEYRQLARLAGIQSSYCRAFPRVIVGLGPRYAGKAVTSQSASTLPRWDGAGLFDLF